MPLGLSRRIPVKIRQFVLVDVKSLIPEAFEYSSFDSIAQVELQRFLVVS